MPLWRSSKHSQLGSICADKLSSTILSKAFKLDPLFASESSLLASSGLGGD
jgi:hypothetical protein